jgi:hypothetical protein
MATVLYVEGTQAPIAPRSAPSFTLEELQVLVGGYIEVVALRPQCLHPLRWWFGAVLNRRRGGW